MSDCTPQRRRRQIETPRAQFAQADGLPFADVWPARRAEQALHQEGVAWRHKVYAPVLTPWAFLTQVASPDGSCRAAVSRVLAWLAAQGRPAGAPGTGPYCQARARRPESLPGRLARETGRALHGGAEPGWLWRGRRVKAADGTTVSMPDTRANQQAYPQHGAQQPGLGFPIARVVVVFCLATGAALDAAPGRYRGRRTGEAALLRQLDDALGPGDVVLGDRGFGGYFERALWRARGVDAVVRLHQARRPGFRAGRRLGPRGHAVAWAKPARPEWLDGAADASLPGALEVREVAVRVPRRGFRTRRLVVVTTLLDADAYPGCALAALYRARWHAELDLRSLKVAPGRDALRCRTPEMVREEFWMHLLAYSLIRAVMARAAHGLGCPPRELSFRGALQAVQAFGERLLGADEREAAGLHERLLVVVGGHRVGDRPDRVEPRARKRRPKPYPLLTEPREVARNKRQHKS